MSKQRDTKLERIFHDALDMEASARGSFVRRECGSDKMLAADVKSLLKAYDDEPLFLCDTPIDAESDWRVTGAGQRSAMPARSTPPWDSSPSPILDLPEADEDDGPRMFGKYRLISEIGRGAQGCVYHARDERLHRDVALKILLLPLTFCADAVERFRREASAAARMDDPGICTVYEAGTLQGVPFIAMRYLKGETLAAKLSRARKEPQNSGPNSWQLPRSFSGTWTAKDSSPSAQLIGILGFVERVARSLHLAHEHGMVHRDIKPANIMVTPDGSPVLLDFGLVRDSEQEGKELTNAGDVMGTPHYMAPELLENGRASKSSDVYALAATLHECLTLSPPFDAATRQEIFNEILLSEVPDPRHRNSHISRDLATVIEVGLERDCSRRYSTALNFADELQRVREHRPIRARSAGPLLRLRRVIQRHPVALGFTLLILVVMLGALLLSGRVIREQQRALRHSQSIALAGESVRLSDVNGVRALLLAKESVKKEANLVSIAALQQACSNVHECNVLSGHEHFVSYVETSPVTDHILSAGGDGTARIWSGSQLTATLFADSRKGDLLSRFSPDGRRVATVAQNGTVALWASDGNLLREIESSAQFLPAVFSHDGEHILWITRSRELKLWRSADEDTPGHVLQSIPVEGVHQFLVPSPSHPEVLCITRSGRTRLLSLPSLQSTEAKWQDSYPVDACAFSPDGGRVVLVRRTGPPSALRWGVYIWDGKSEPHLLLEQVDKIVAVQFSPDGSRIAYATGPGLVALLPLTGAPPEILLYEGGMKLEGLGFSPNGQWIVAHGRRESLVISTLGTAIESLAGHRHWIEKARFMANGNLVTASADRTLRIWTLDWKDGYPNIPAGTSDGFFFGGTFSPRGESILCTGRGAWIVNREGDRIQTLIDRDLVCDYGTFSPDGSQVAICRSETGTIEVMGVDGTHVQTLTVPFSPDRLRSVAFSPDGEQILASWLSLLVWNKNGDLIMGPPATLERGPVDHYLTYTSFSQDGSRLLSSGINGAALWDSDFNVDYVYPGQQTRFSQQHPDGKRVVTFHADGRARMWALHGDTPLTTFSGHEGALWRCDLNADGTLLATASNDQTARVWDVESGECLQILRGHRGPVIAAEFSPDGKTLLTTSMDGMIRLWPLEMSELQRIAQQRCHRELSVEERTLYQELLK